MICTAPLARTEMALPNLCSVNVQGMPQQSRLGGKMQRHLREAQRKRNQVSLLAASLCSACMYELSVTSFCRDCSILWQMIRHFKHTMSKDLAA